TTWCPPRLSTWPPARNTTAPSAVPIPGTPTSATSTVASRCTSALGAAFDGALSVVSVPASSMEPASQPSPAGRGTPRRSVVLVAGHSGVAGAPHRAPAGGRGPAPPRVRAGPGLTRPARWLGGAWGVGAAGLRAG